MNRFGVILLFCGLLAGCAQAQQMDRASEPAWGMAEMAYDEVTMARSEAAALPPVEPMAPGEEFATSLTDPGQERLIIRTGHLSVVVVDTETTIADIARLATRSGGWVVSSNVYQYDERAKMGSIALRVPAERFDEVVAAIKTTAVSTTSETTDSRDVTDDYVDLSARLSNLEATAERVRAFLDEAQNVEEALDVNRELSRLEEQIEVIKGRMQYLSQSAAFSTINVEVRPDILSQPLSVAGWEPQGTARQAVEALVTTLQGLVNLGIWLLIFVIPLALLILVPSWLFIRSIRRRRHAATTA